MDIAVPWIALAASLASLAASIRLLLWIANRPPIQRHRTVIGVCAQPNLSPPANRNEPSMRSRPLLASKPRLNLTAIAVAIAGPGSILAAVIGSGWLWSLQP